MAGNTDSTNLLTALNQAVKAINDLIVGSGTTVVEAPNVTVRPNITINCSCGGGGGTKLPDPPVSETDPPPAGYEPDPNIDQRKCKAANYVFDGIYGLIDKLDKAHADTYESAAFTAWLALVGAIIGTGFAPVVGTVAGALTGIAIALITDVEASDVLNAMTARKQDIICAFYYAGNTEEAKSEFLNIMSEEGVNGLSYVNFCGFFLIADTLRVLFQAVDWVSEATIGAYAGSNCGGCGQNFYIIDGIPGNTETNLVIYSTDYGSYHAVGVGYITTGMMTSISTNGLSSVGTWGWLDINNVWHNVQPNASLLLNVCTKAWYIASSVPFSAEINHNKGC